MDSVRPKQHLQENVSFQPVGGKVCVEMLPDETVTASGIILPGRDRARPIMGKVKAVGAGRISDSGVLLPMEVKVNDRVLLHNHSGTEIKSAFHPACVIVDGQDDILAILKPEVPF